MVAINFFLLGSEAAAEVRGFGINSNILETNLINIIIILAVLIYFGRGLIGKILSQRLANIESAIQDAEKRQQVAVEQLSVQQQKLAQTQTECDRLLKKAEQDAKVAKEAIFATVAADIERVRAAAQREMDTEQERAIAQLRQQVSEKSLAQVGVYLNRGLSETVQHQLVDRSLELLNPNVSAGRS
jgi:F-type H+-transporting ATPase subunit b